MMQHSLWKTLKTDWTVWYAWTSWIIVMCLGSNRQTQRLAELSTIPMYSKMPARLGVAVWSLRQIATFRCNINKAIWNMTQSSSVKFCFCFFNLNRKPVIHWHFAQSSALIWINLWGHWFIAKAIQFWYKAKWEKSVRNLREHEETMW